MKIRKEQPIWQADFREEVRRSCRIVVDRIGGIRKFVELAQEQGLTTEGESTWYNRLHPERTVGFDVDWLDTVYQVTGDYEVFMPFFRSGGPSRKQTITKIANKSGYTAILIHGRLWVEKEEKTSKTKGLILALFEAAQRLVAKGGEG